MVKSPSPPDSSPRVVRKSALILLGLAVAVGLSGVGSLVGQRWQFALNETESLPHWAFIIDRSQTQPARGDYFAFIAPPNRYYPRGFRFTKRIVGVPGDIVAIDARRFYINGVAVGEAKPADKQGQPVDPADAGVIPPGRYFVVTPHPDSLDSRYKMIGLIAADRLVGRAHPVM